MKLTKEERDDVAVSLNMRCNYIETGTISYSAADVENMGNHAPSDAKIKALSKDQMETLIRMKKLMVRLYSEGKVGF